MKKIAVLLLATLCLVGCAMDSTAKSRLKNVDYMKDNLNVYGAFTAQLAGTISWIDNSSCSKNAFMLYARKEKNIDKLVDVIMKETCTQPDPGTLEKRCGCEYSGIGMKYRQIDAKEAALWNAASSGTVATTVEERESNSFAPSGPANEAMYP